MSTNIYDNSFQILQTPDAVVIRYEEIHEARIIPPDRAVHAHCAGQGRVDYHLRRSDDLDQALDVLDAPYQGRHADHS